MPELTGSTGHIDAVLSNFAVMAFNADGDWIGDKLLPKVPVGKQSDLYYTLDIAPFLRDEGVHALRAPRTQAKRVTYGVSTGTYYAPNYALAHDFGLEEFANLDAVLRGQQRTSLVVSKLRRAQEVRIANLLTSISNVGSGVALTGADKWSDYTSSDPLGVITTAQAFIQGATGVVPNTLALDWNTWKVLRRHPQLLDMYKYTSGGEVTPEQIKSAFDVETLLVARSIKENQREGTGATSKTSIWGNCAILAYVGPNTTFEEPSTGAVRFAWDQNGIYPGEFGVMRTVYDGAGSIHAETIEVGHFQDEKVVARDMIYTVTGTL
jgi:hypothetical protein